MNPILFTAAKAAERVMLAQEVKSNNLAHSDTIGFKALMERSTAMKTEGAGFLTSVTARTNSAINNFEQGDEIVTNQPLDMAIDGMGFFAVQGLAGEPNELYTRAGNFNANAAGELILGQHKVMGLDGPVVLPEYQSINVSENGNISIIPAGGGAAVDVATIKTVKPEYNNMTLDKSGYFVPVNGGILAANEVTVRSGYLESSNVSSLEELVSMMSLTRQYEMQVKAMATADEIAQMGNKLLRS